MRYFRYEILIKSQNRCTMSKKLRNLSIAALLAGVTTTQALAQNTRGGVGIGTEQPDPSAALEIQSKEQGFLLPRMSLQQRNSIKSPAKGLMVYQTDMLSGIYVYNGKDWAPLTATEAKATALDPDNWALTGNTNATANSFIGVPAGVPINFRIGGVRVGVITNSTNIFMGIRSGTSTATGTNNAGFGANTLANLSSGSFNAGIGSFALERTTTGSYNMALGSYSLRVNTTGGYNTGVGSYSLGSNIGGIENVGLGYAAMAFNSAGNANIAIGNQALMHNTDGSRNVAIGLYAGMQKNGTGNIYLGANAGRVSALTSESNKLYVANTNTLTPLIYGDFSAKFISIGDVPVAKRDAIASAGQYGLLVKGGIMTEKIKVALASSTDWADYVFEPTYQQNMLSLREVEQFILEHKHLPNVPSAQEMADNGLDVTQTVAKLMEKIEELTLYAIEMDKQIKQLQTEKEELKKKAKKRK